MSSTCWLSPNQEISVHQYHYLAGDLDSLPHTHAEYNIAFCLEQTVDYVVDGRKHTLQPGDVLVINPGEVHWGEYSSGQLPTHGLTLAITQQALRKLLRETDLLPEAEDVTIVFAGKISDQTAWRLAQELLAELEQKPRGYQLVMRCLIPHILVHLLRRCVAPEIVRPELTFGRQLPTWQMIKAMEYMNRHGKSAFSLTEMCAEIGSSPSRFIRLFETSTQTSPQVYYNRLVIRKAQALLRNSRYSIKEVAYELGFLNQSHFCRLFRCLSGVTATAFREQS